MTIVVVGGGPTGVELAGAFAELARTVLKRDFRRIDPAQARIILIEAAPSVLSHLPPDLAAERPAPVGSLGVQVRTSTRVRDIQPRRSRTRHRRDHPRGEYSLGRRRFRRAADQQARRRTGRSGRVKVNPDLSLPGHPEVFAIGDLALVLRENGKPVPGVSPAAMQMARHVARIIGDELDLGPGRAPRPPFKYWDKGTMATIGRSAAVAWIGRLKFSGLFAWLAWLFVHLIFLIGFRNRLAVLLQWTYSYFAYKRGARIITGLPRNRRPRLLMLQCLELARRGDLRLLSLRRGLRLVRSIQSHAIFRLNRSAHRLNTATPIPARTTMLSQKSARLAPRSTMARCSSM